MTRRLQGGVHGATCKPVTWRTFPSLLSAVYEARGEATRRTDPDALAHVQGVCGSIIGVGGHFRGGMLMDRCDVGTYRDPTDAMPQRTGCVCPGDRPRAKCGSDQCGGGILAEILAPRTAIRGLCRNARHWACRSVVCSDGVGRPLYHDARSGGNC